MAVIGYSHLVEAERASWFVERREGDICGSCTSCIQLLLFTFSDGMAAVYRREYPKDTTVQYVFVKCLHLNQSYQFERNR